jgi:rhamnose utilization protein RhaD (predicted bifunctional aldolase and dehydrogenase)
MDEIEPLYNRDEMTDEEMVAYLERTWFEQGRPRQSIETLLHAFVPHKHVDHTHPDAVISLMCVDNAEEEARKVYGDRMAYVPYIRPGFTLRAGDMGIRQQIDLRNHAAHYSGNRGLHRRKKNRQENLW